jgi:uncharacterized membrane protein
MKKKTHNYFLTGIISLIPLVLTLFIMIKLFKFFLGFVGSLIPIEYISARVNTIFVLESNGILISRIITYIVTLAVLYFTVLLTGFFVKHLLNVEKTKYIEAIFLKIPLIKPIYTTIKQIVEMILSNSKSTDKTVVILEYPRAGVYSIGFMTNTNLGKLNDYLPKEKEMVNVFIPTAPNPTTGFYIMVSRKEIKEVDMKVDEALKLIVSAGAIVPQ